MKKIIVLFLMMALILTGCTKQAQPAAPVTDDLIVVGMVQVGAESDWRVANTESMKAQFTEENGYRLLFEDARQKQENQTMAVRKFIHQQVDYIILMPISEFGWTSVLQDAKDAGIPVILVDRMVDVDDDSLYTAHVGSDFLRQGMKATGWMARNFMAAENLNIVHIQGTPGATSQIGRTSALEKAVEAHENWHILVQLDGDYTQPKAYTAMSKYLDELEDETKIDVVYCENDNEAFGAIEALEEHGYKCGKDVKIISFDATRQCLQLCMEGKISLAVECNPLLGPMAAEIIQMLEAGETPTKQQFVPEMTYTSANVTQEIINDRKY